MSVRAWRRGMAEFERLVQDGLVRALPQYDDRNRDLYLSDVTARERRAARLMVQHDDAIRRYADNTIRAVRLPQPQSGRAWWEREKAKSDWPFFNANLQAAEQAVTNDLLRAVVALLKEER